MSNTSSGFEKRIERAKRNQKFRVGSRVSKRKKCRKGKSCGASCISFSKFCMVDLPWVSQEITRLKTEVLAAPIFKPAKGTIFGNTLEEKGAKENVNLTLDTISQSKETRDIDGSIQANKVNWMAGVGEGAKHHGTGYYGTFMTVPSQNLAEGIASQFPDGVGIKYGSMKPGEAELLKKISDLNVGPKFIAARLEENDRIRDRPRRERAGMIAMGKVPGLPMDKLDSSGIKAGEQANLYIRTIARLHKAGISHGDAHLGNILVDGNKAKFVDFGYANASPKSALTEAINVALGRGTQTRLFGTNEMPGNLAQTLRGNVAGVVEKLQRMGIDAKNLDSLSDPDPLRKVSDSQAMSMVSQIYKGV